ncbi:transposase [Laspinema sp. D1]|uniref:Transposase n=1 Tax=Laspinema palackyanum D2a TaxID=2953684 RepID=A0ABT2MVR2_9CYAN|nr:transposase [Laspinema sp. D2b]MCT7968839.1 transposase [Laspinema sp. D2a]
MQLVERHLIKKTHKYWQECDALCFKAKNLYNLCNYYMRQRFFETGQVWSNTKLYHLVASSDAYKQMPSTKIACSLIRQVCQAWTGYFNAHKDWKVNPEKYLQQPKILKYKDKVKGRFAVIYKGSEAIYKKPLADGICHLSQSDIKIQMPRAKNPVQARIVPKNGCYLIEVVYEIEELAPKKTDEKIAGIDVGVDNLVALSCNDSGVRPLLVNGKPLKSINRLYNKTRSRIQSKIGDRKTSNRLDGITFKRNNQIHNYLHLTSSIVVNYLTANGITTLIVGKNEGWKQEVNIGKRNNQNFVQIPHAKLIEMLDYKCQLAGIKLVTVNEAYTSKCSALDLEPIQKHHQYLGRRVHRGLFKSSTGRVINADINGSLNIIRMYSPEAFTVEGIASCGVQPLKVNPLKRVG